MHREDILDLAIVPLRPQAEAVGGVAQLCRDAYPLAGAPHRALKHGPHVQLLADHLQLLVLPLERERRCAPGDAQVGNGRERVEDLLGDTVGEEFVLGIAAHVGERQHGERFLGRGVPWRGRFGFAEGRNEQGAGLVAIDRRPGERPLHGTRHRAWHALSQSSDVGRRLHEPLGDHGLQRRPGERLFPHQHFVEHATERIDVAAAVNGIAGGLLRTHVGGRADTSAGLGERVALHRAERFPDTEVRHEGVPVREQDVFGLDVAMDHAMTMGVVERAGRPGVAMRTASSTGRTRSRDNRSRNDSPSTAGMT